MEAQLQKLNFLIVEDLVSDIFLLQRQLKKICEDPEIRFVDSKLALANAIKNYIPDFVLCDFNLNDYDAFDVIEIIQRYNSDIPVIIITGNLKNRENEEKLLAEGASGFFLKDPLETLNERLLPLFITLSQERKSELEGFSKKRKEINSYRKNVDFLRQHETLSANNDDLIESNSKEESFLSKIKKLFK